MRDKLKETAEVEILNATERLWMEGGLESLSMASIAKASGVAVGTLYNYFSDKEALLRRLLESSQREVYESFNQSLSGLGEVPFEQLLTKFLSSLFATDPVLERFARITQAYQRASIHVPTMDEPRDIASQAFIDFVKPLIKQGVREKILRSDSTEYLPILLLAIIRSISPDRRTGRISQVKAVDVAKRLFLEGAGTRSK